MDGRHKFFTYLKKGLDFKVRKKELKRIPLYDDEIGDSIQEKGNMDVEMTIDAIHYAKNIIQPYCLLAILIFSHW